MKRLLSVLALALLVLIPASGAFAQRQTLNLRDADIRAFIQDVSRATGRTFIIDPRVRGTVNVVSDEALSRDELFEVLLSTLRANGLVAIPTSGGAYRIAPEEGAAQQAGSVSGAAGAGFSTQVFRLRSIDAASAAETLKPLVGRNGVVTASPRGNSIIVSDYTDNLRRIRGLVGQIDQDRAETRTITLQNSSARELAGVVNGLLAAPGAEANARNPLVNVVVVESSNSLVLRGDADAIARVVPIIADLDRRAESSDDVRVVRLQHANAEQLLPVLQQLVGAPVTQPSNTSLANATERDSAPRSSGRSASAAAPSSASAATEASGPPIARANIARYPGANALVIAAEPNTQRLLAEVIRQLDVRREQVLVEAIVVEVSDNAARQLGVQFILAGRDGDVPFAATNYSNTAPNILALAGAIASRDDDSDVAEGLRDAAVRSLLGANGLIGGFAGEINDEALFGFVLNAVKRDDQSNILSTPSIMTLDNEEATILVGQEVPITTGEVLGDNNANPFRTTQRQNVGVQLEVKPQINAGGGITLFLRQEVSSVNGAASATFEEVVLDKREIETTVLVDDGDIVVLGGLLDQVDRDSTQKVPVLGDLPVIGNLFRSNGRERTKRNLMVFIRPTIVRNPRDAQAVTAPRYDYIRRDQIGTSRDGVSSLDELVDQYMRTRPPVAPAPLPAGVQTQVLPATPVAPR